MYLRKEKLLGFERRLHKDSKFQIMFYRTLDSSNILIPFKTIFDKF